MKQGVAQNQPSSALVIGCGAGFVGAAFDLAGLAANFGSLASVTPNAGGLVTNSSGTAATLTVGSDNTSTTFGGSLIKGGGALALTKVGTGTMTLTGTNTMTGALTLTGGGGLTLDIRPTYRQVRGTSGSGGRHLHAEWQRYRGNRRHATATTIGIGNSTVNAQNGAGQSLTFNTGVISHGGGVVNFNLPTTGAINVGTTPLVNGILGAWATITTPGGHSLPARMSTTTWSPRPTTTVKRRRMTSPPGASRTM